jgi:gamma-D-glutamyl-L-lysine dipeptidyl-peptidase
LCSVAVAPVRAEPRDDAERVTELLEGESVRVEEERDGWARIVTAYDYPGWVRADMLAGRSGDPVAEARGYLGSPYLWGGLTNRGIDCSGLVHMAYRRLGLLVPRDADQQEAAAVEIATEELRPGDLVTYGDERNATHIAFWLGDGRILHATDREDANGVLEELEPDELRTKRRRFVRFVSNNAKRSSSQQERVRR